MNDLLGVQLPALPNQDERRQLSVHVSLVASHVTRAVVPDVTTVVPGTAFTLGHPNAANNNRDNYCPCQNVVWEANVSFTGI